MHYKNNYKALFRYSLFSNFYPVILALAVNASALEIEVSKEDWGNAGEEDIKAVLHSAASASQAPPAKPEACELEPLKAAIVVR